MHETVQQIKKNLQTLYRSGIKLSPVKMHLLRLLPILMLQLVFTFVFKSRFEYTFMYRHSMKAPDEMNRLHVQLYRYLEFTIDRKLHLRKSKCKRGEV